MHFVYVLRSQKDHRFYIGSTENVERRLLEHNSGQQAATRYRRPLEVVYVECLPDRQSAVRREQFLKRQKSHRFIEGLILQRQANDSGSE